MEHFEAYKKHVLTTIRDAAVSPHPFFHLFIEGIFPAQLYDAIHARALHYKSHEARQPRQQDSKDFTNERYRLFDNDDVETSYIRALFSDEEIKEALLRKFYVAPGLELSRSLTIHKEFEYVYTAKGRFQDIHVDIPGKFLSFVFYLPENPLNERDQQSNSTILYDKDLNPCYKARYTGNSVCIFAPHFHSYHGFSTTLDRTALVMFYVNQKLLRRYQRMVGTADPSTQVEAFKDSVQRKLEDHPLIEYGVHHDRIAMERRLCRINTPLGRVMPAASAT